MIGGTRQIVVEDNQRGRIKTTGFLQIKVSQKGLGKSIIPPVITEVLQRFQKNSRGDEDVQSCTDLTEEVTGDNTSSGYGDAGVGNNGQEMNTQLDGDETPRNGTGDGKSGDEETKKMFADVFSDTESEAGSDRSVLLSVEADL